MGKELVLFAILVSLIVGATFGYVFHLKKTAREMEDLAYYRATNLWKTGWSEPYGSYQLRSFDGGLHWYAINNEKDGVIIKGLAEEVFPGLLAHLEGWEKLTKYVEKNGPITLSGSRSAEDLSVLAKAGFTVEAK